MSRSCCVLSGVSTGPGKMRMCGFADVRIFEVVKCGEILRILTADVMGKMRMWECGYDINERMPIAYFNRTFALNIPCCCVVLHG